MVAIFVIIAIIVIMMMMMIIIIIVCEWAMATAPFLLLFCISFDAIVWQIHPHFIHTYRLELQQQYNDHKLTIFSLKLIANRTAHIRTHTHSAVAYMITVERRAYMRIHLPKWKSAWKVGYGAVQAWAHTRFQIQFNSATATAYGNNCTIVHRRCARVYWHADIAAADVAPLQKPFTSSEKSLN